LQVIVSKNVSWSLRLKNQRREERESGWRRILPVRPFLTVN
jgi:hypothetical protein